MPKTASGKAVMKILTKHFGFYFVSQKGSHVKLKKSTTRGTVLAIIPLHRELAQGTLRGILELAKIDRQDFERFL
ncbi:MAG: type II toxin-antitoxin system HicA family toxin [bacterium]|nr:type II toxin-antitoxin system HicA family toxin [bacterium]